MRDDKFNDANFPDVGQQNVIWDSPSYDSSGSMPLGNGDIGVNVWAEKDGDLLFYLAKTDSWSEIGRLLKLGRVRVNLSPNPFIAGLPFLQTLYLERGEVVIEAGENETAVRLRVWVDAHAPVVRVEVESAAVFDAQISMEMWRDAPHTLHGSMLTTSYCTNEERHSAYGLSHAPWELVEVQDEFLPQKDDRLTWYHRNPASTAWEKTLDSQGLSDWKTAAQDPLLNRTFGGTIFGKGLQAQTDTTLSTVSPVTRLTVSIVLLTAQTDTVDEWRTQLEALIANVQVQDDKASRNAHYEWWRQFWKRSYIFVTGDGDADLITRAYTLQRYISACAGRGAFPIKFNGSLFTVNSNQPDKLYNADYRMWGGPYWFQNTRLIYWPLLASGDFDLMRPLFEMYRHALPLAKFQTQAFFGHGGAFFPETMCFWGTYTNDDYGWDRNGKETGTAQNSYIARYWSGALELCVLMLSFWEATQDAQFCTDTLLPVVDAVLDFYDQHYSRDTNGLIVFAPAAALETHQDVINPLPEIAGLTFLLGGLLHNFAGDKRCPFWQRLQGELPPIPIALQDDLPVLAPAAQILDKVRNSENAALYAVFPYGLYGLGKPNLDVARRTWAQRPFPGNVGWRQDAIQAAQLGLAEEARAGIVQRFGPQKTSGSRFPAFWGPNFDWIPDQDHGCVGMLALQRMILQADGSVIRLLPAWPQGWDVSFRLHASQNTVAEGIYRRGVMEYLTVTPEHRFHDVTIDLA